TVPQHKDEPNAQLRDGILNAALDNGACATYHVPRHANHKEIADSLIEDHLGGDARIRAADDDGDRLLPFSQCRELFRRPSRVGDAPFVEPFIALKQLLEYGIGSEGRSWFVGSWLAQG